MMEKSTSSNKKSNFWTNRNFISVSVLILITILFRLYKFDSPLVEYHAWRQADTLAVARNFARDGFDLFHPRYDDISKLQSGLDNPNGYRMVEFPIYNAIVGIAYKILPFMPIEQVGRLINILLSCLSTFLIYSLVRKLRGTLAAWISTIVFATFPFFVFYTRAALPETLAMTFILLSIYVSINESRPILYRAIIAFVFFALAILTKPTTIFFGLVPFGLLALESPIKRKTIISLIFISLLSLAPFVAWREYIKLYPEGIPSSEWLLTHINTQFGLESIFFKPAFFRWIFFERINVLILGSFAFALPAIGLLAKMKRNLHLLLSLSTGIYLFTFQGGNVQHEYYQILILPTLAILLGVGADHLIKTQKNVYYSVATCLLILIILIASWFTSFDKVKHYYYSLSDIPQFAKVVKDLTNPDDLIIVDSQGDTTTLFAFDRKGSPAILASPPDLKVMGYDYLFTYNQTTASNMIREYNLKVMFRNNRFALLKL